jgi:hypothetical protein
MATRRAFLAMRADVRAEALADLAGVLAVAAGAVWALASASRNTERARVKKERSIAEMKDWCVDARGKYKTVPILDSQ